MLYEGLVGAILGGLGGAVDLAQTLRGNKKSSLVGARLPKISMEDFVNTESPVWNNVDYEDAETQSRLMWETHQQMVGAGSVVVVPEETLRAVGEKYPDLRSVKKKDRNSILRSKLDELKISLRNTLNGLKGKTFDFAVNGNILEAKLYDTGVREVMERITKESANALFRSEDIFKNAQYLYSTPDYEGNPNIYRWNYFYTPVKIGEDTTGVRIAVRDLKEGTNNTPESQIYHWGTKKEAALGGGRPNVSAPSSGASSAASKSIIPDSHSEVNNEPRYLKTAEQILTEAEPKAAAKSATTEAEVPKYLAAPGLEELMVGGRATAEQQEMFIRRYGQDAYDRIVLQGMHSGEIVNEGADLYSTKKETRAPGYYGGGKDAKYIDALAKASGCVIERAKLRGGEKGYYVNGRAVLAEEAGVEIARHEVAHHLRQTAPEEFREFLGYAKRVYGSRLEEALETIRGDYAERGLTLDGATAEEELAAFFAGELLTDETAMRRLAGENLSLAERFLAWIRNSLAKVSRALGRESVEAKQLREGAALFEKAIHAAKQGTAEGGSVRHAIETLPDGKRYVKADRQVIFGNDPDSWAEQLENYINGKIRGGQDVTLIGADGDELLLTSDSAGKLSDNHTSDGRTMSEEAYERKVGAAAHIDELAQISNRGKKDVADVGGRHGDMASGGWNYRTAYFEDFDNTYYKVTLSVARGIDGDMIYNVGNMKKEAHPKIKGSRAVSGDGLRGFASSANSISDSAGKSNTKSSGGRRAVEGTAEKLEDLQRLERQNRRLEEKVRKLEHELRLEKKGGSTDRAETKKVAKEIMKRYSSRVDADQLTNRMLDLYDGTMRGELSQAEMKEISRGIARYVLDGSVQQINTMYEEYGDLRRELRGTKLKLEKEYRADLDHVGGYEAFRKSNMGSIVLSKDGVSVDAVYEGLSQRYPHLFPDDIYHPADQLIQIANAAQNLKAVMGNPFEGRAGDAAAEFLANDIIESFFDIPTTQTAQLQKDRAQMERQRKADREAAERRIKNLKTWHRKHVSDIMLENARRNAEREERQSASAKRKQLLAGTERLAKRLIRPTNQKHVPEELQGLVQGFVTMMNLESGFEWQMQKDGKYKRVPVGEGEPTTRTAKARELKAKLDELKKAGYGIDPMLWEYLEKIALLGEKQIVKMNREELDVAWNVMRAIQKLAEGSDQMLGESKYARVSELAQAIRRENGGKKEKRALKDGAQWLANAAGIEMMTPETFLHKLGRPGDEIFRQMRRAADRQTEILKEGSDFAAEAIRKSGLDVKKLESETMEFDFGGEKLQLSRAQMMNLYALWKREQAREHLALGGILPTKLKGRGVYAVQRAEPVWIGLEGVGKILGELTKQETALVDELQGYLSGTLSDHGNEATLKVYGYRKFLEKLYWPIKVNRAETQSDPALAAEAKTVAGFGMTKLPQPHAKNSLEIGSFMDVFTDHLSEMATYAGWLATSEDLNRVYNYQFDDHGDGETRKTVKGMIARVHGSEGGRYWEKLMGDVAMGTKAGSDGSMMDWAVANTKAAAVGANLRVVLQQPTSLLRVLDVMSPKYLVNSEKGGWKEALKYAPIAQWKDWGYFESNTGRTVRQMILGQETKLGKLREFSMALAGKADSVTWGHIWNMAKAETKDRIEAAERRRGESPSYESLIEKPDMRVVTLPAAERAELFSQARSSTVWPEKGGHFDWTLLIEQNKNFVQLRGGVNGQAA